MFENPEIPLSDLPGAEAVDWQSLDPGFIKRLRVQAAIGVAIPLIVVSVISNFGDAPLPFILAAFTVILGIAIIAFVWPPIAVRHCGYAVRDKDMLFKKGVIWRSVTAVPFNRIQHVETSHTPLDRKFGIATLKLFTAGGSGGDLKIEGLAADTAEELRLYILEKTGASIEDA